MKNQWSSRKPAFPAKWRVTAGCLVAICCAAIAVPQLWSPEDYLAETSLALPADQIIKLPDLSDTKAFEWAAFSIQNPAKAHEMIEALKTPERKAQDEWKRLSIMDPDGYRAKWAAEFPDSPLETSETSALREQSHYAFLNPYEAEAVREAWRSPEERKRSEIALFAILQPVEFNQIIQPFKTREYLEKEALAAYALEQPESFNADVKRAWEKVHGVKDAAVENGGPNE